MNKIKCINMKSSLDHGLAVVVHFLHATQTTQNLSIYNTLTPHSFSEQMIAELLPLQSTPRVMKVSYWGWNEEQAAEKVETSVFEPKHSDPNPKRELTAAALDQHLLKVVLESISAVVTAVVLSVQGDGEQAVSRRALVVVVVAAAAVLGDRIVPCFDSSVAAEATIAKPQYSK